MRLCHPMGAALGSGGSSGLSTTPARLRTSRNRTTITDCISVHSLNDGRDSAHILDVPTFVHPNIHHLPAYRNVPGVGVILANRSTAHQDAGQSADCGPAYCPAMQTRRPLPTLLGGG